MRSILAVLLLGFATEWAAAQAVIEITPAAPAESDATAPAAESDAAAPASPLYVRIDRANDRDRAMQTAIVRFEGQPGTRHDGAVVDLFGVVHIGEGDYYDEINRRLKEYDAVLYELVAPDGTRIRPADLRERRGVVSSLQSGMKDVLGLEYQLERVDYLPENFRHADMNPEEFAEDFEKRGDSPVKMFARMIGAGLAASGGGGDGAILMAMLTGNRGPGLKKAMAKQLIRMEAVTAGIDDANGDNTLIKGRNEKAFRILRDALNEGDETIAVFYGAGHLQDMAEKLEEDFGMKPVSTTWLDAWDLTDD